MKEYRIFISHAWRYNEDYYRLVGMLNRAPYFRWRNYSVPQHDPVIDPDTEVGKRKLTEELRKQIQPVHIVIVLAGMYVNYREWIQKEIDIAQEYKKPIVGIRPWGQQRIPQIIQDISCKLVGWNTDSIVQAIRECSL